MKIGSDIGLDQRSDLRGDAAWHEARLAEPSSRTMIMVELRPVILSNEARTECDIRWFQHDEIIELGLKLDEFMFLGLDSGSYGSGGGRAHYCVAIPEAFVETLSDRAGNLKPNVDLRSLADQGVMRADELSLIGMARSLSVWHSTHKYCGKCGGRQEVQDRGWRLNCPACDRDQFPRMDPVVIMLVTYGEQCLLARDVRFPETLYSTLAGFLEPGEDIEAAVRREVFEEVGLRLRSVAYKFSQPWPFPHSMMIGCIAEAKSSAIRLDKNEIADAFWVDKIKLKELLGGSEAGSIDLPKNFAIAHHLMREFLKAK